MASTLQGVTAPKSLFHSDLCQIRAGIPAEEALQEASTFLASARNIAWAIQDQNHSDLPYAAVCMIDLAKGLIDATLSGSTEKNQGQLEAADRRVLDVLERIVRFVDGGVLLINPDADELAADDAQQFIECAQRKTKRANVLNSPDEQPAGEVANFDRDYFATAFKTISSLAARCVDEPGTNSADIIWSIQELAERWACELESKGGGNVR